ncbi:MAG: bifunctional riboflavin kinase/FAD synthetase [Acidimicrobiaceae bacterium]|nr:bifunctional riboflavin kinase/FAD synthetase [Acidimicrobiaceae bacterium]
MKLSNFDAEMQRPSVVAFGVFDGLHLGHQALIEHVVRLSSQQGAVASIVTFDPHPALVLSALTAPYLIGTLEQRLEGFESLGIDQVGVLSFDEFAARESAASFIERVLVGYLATTDLVVGDDVHFGRGREGDITLLVHEGERHGFRVHSSPTYGGEHRYSSTSVRARLDDGDVAGARDILGRPFVLRAKVVHGDGRGRTMGFPTANLDVAPRQKLPARGVYAAAVRWGGNAWRCAAVSVGTRPQFYDDGQLLVEVHVPDFEGDLYDQVLDVAFLERLRGEATFATLEELLAQMSLDVRQSQEIFEKFTPGSWVLLG